MSNEPNIQYIELEKLKPNPYQPKSRQNVPEETVKLFADSILQHGLIQIPIVRVSNGEYQIGDGWLRRAGYEYLAAKGNGTFKKLPVQVKELTDQQMADLVMEANTIRKDLTPIELAQFFKRYLEDFKVTQADLAQRHSCSQGEIANTIRLLKLPEDIQEEIISQKISATMGLALLPVLDLPEKTQKKIFKEAHEPKTTVRDIDQEVKRTKWDSSLSLDPKNKTWDGSDTPAFDVASCAKCEHRKVISHPWRDNEKQPRCDDKKCWHEKQREAKAGERQKILAELEKRGISKLYNVGELQYDQYERNPGDKDILDKPGDCKNCEHRAGMIDQYNENRVLIVCTDPTCWHGKRNKRSHTKNLAEAEAERKRKEKLERDFQGINIHKHHVLLTTIECLLRTTYGATDIMAEVFHVIEKDGDKPIRMDQIRKALAVKTHEELLAFLPRLSYEILRSRYSFDDKLHKHMLDQFLGVPEKSKQPTPKTPLAAPKSAEKAPEATVKPTAPKKIAAPPDNKPKAESLTTSETKSEPQTQAVTKELLAKFYPDAKDPLAAFQKANCPGCHFAVKERIGTGVSCCIVEKEVTVDDKGTCQARRSGDEL
jgi:ParB family chromosome partitioning protein